MAKKKGFAGLKTKGGRIMEGTRPLEILEDDLFLNPILIKMIRDGKCPLHLDLSTRAGKLWFGHSYRVARELLCEKDAGLRLVEVAWALLAASMMLPKEFVEECILLAIDEIKNGRPGIPTVSVDDPEKLAAWRERVLSEEEKGEA